MRKLFGLIYTLPLLLAIVLLYLLHTLNPIHSGPMGILSVFICIYLLIVASIFVLTHLGTKVYRRITQGQPNNEMAKKYKANTRRMYYFASILAFGPVMLLALQSVRQLSIADIGLVTLFLLLACFYISKKAQ